MTLADRLASPEGAAVLAAIGPDAVPPGEVLRLGERLRRAHDPALVAAALTLHDLRVAARDRFTRADRMWLTRPGLEQSTAEPIARRHAARFQDHGVTRLADLCTGIGGDLVALAAVAEVLAVDRDPEHLRMATLNAAVYDAGDHVTPWEGDVREADLSGVGGVFIDPARRAGDRRMGPGASEPPLEWAVALADRVPAVGIKAAPGIDHDAVPPGWELELVADGRDLKEAALWSPALATAPRRATVLLGDGPGDDRAATMTAVPGNPVPVCEPVAWLLDPNPAVTRAGLVEDLARATGARKIDDQIAFLTSDAEVVTPFARTLRVLDSLPWHEKAIAARLRELGIGSVDIRRRGLAGDVDQIRKRLKLAGPNRATLAMTRVRDRPWCVICAG